MADTVKVALLGLGTIGSGVYKLIERQQEEMSSKAGASIEIAAILVHNLGKEREGVDRTLLTDRWEDIINNEEIQIVIELMGGIELARTMILEALKAGKNVVTANKDLVAEYGIQQAPTLIVRHGDQVEKLVNASTIKKFASQSK